MSKQKPYGWALSLMMQRKDAFKLLSHVRYNETEEEAVVRFMDECIAEHKDDGFQMIGTVNRIEIQRP